MARYGITRHFPAQIVAGFLLSGCFQVSGPIDPHAVADDLQDSGPFAETVANSKQLQDDIASGVASAFASELADAGPIADVRASLAAQRTDLDMLVAQVADAGASNAAFRSSTTDLLATLGKRLDADDLQISDLDAGAKDLGTRLTGAEASLSSLQSSVTANSAAIAQLDAGFASTRSQLSVLQGQVLQQAAQISQLDAGVALVAASDALKLPLSGGNLTGDLAVNGAVTSLTSTTGVGVFGQGAVFAVGPQPSFNSAPTSYGLPCKTATMSAFGGYPGARQACVSACGDSHAHVCTVDEAWRGVGAGYVPTSQGAAVLGGGQDCAGFSGPCVSTCAPSCVPASSCPLYQASVLVLANSQVQISTVPCSPLPLTLLCCR